jgi:hypothetical protein
MDGAAKRVRDGLYRRAVREAADKWKGPLPKGWTDKSRMKFWDTLTSGAPKHKVTECIKKMEGKVSNPGAFCASLADRSIPGWREEAAKERRKKKAFAELEKAAATLNQPLRTRRDYGERPEDEEDEEEDKPHSQMPGTDNMTMEEDHRVGSSPWITRDEMESLCPPCAVRMKKAGLTKVHVKAVRRMLQAK